MGLFDRFLDAVRLNDSYDEDEDEFFDEEDDEFEDEQPAQPKKSIFGKLRSGSKDNDLTDDDEDEEEEDEIPAPAPRTEPARAAVPAARTAAKPAAAPSSKVTPMRRSRTSSGPSMNVCVIKPTKVDDYREIADTLLSDCTVVLNLEGMDVELAQRIIDFSSGSCYAIEGGLQKVSSYIFILTPSSVEISGDIQDILNGAIPAMRNSI